MEDQRRMPALQLELAVQTISIRPYETGLVIFMTVVANKLITQR